MPLQQSVSAKSRWLPEVGMYFRSWDCLHGLDLIGDLVFICKDPLQ